MLHKKYVSGPHIIAQELILYHLFSKRALQSVISKDKIAIGVAYFHHMIIIKDSKLNFSNLQIGHFYWNKVITESR